MLAQTKNLRDLSLSGRNLNDVALAGAATGPNLRSLYIWGANVGDGQMADFASSDTLEELCIPGTKFGNAGCHTCEALRS